MADVPSVMRLAGHAACEGLPLAPCLWERERVEAARIADAIADSYNRGGCADMKTRHEAVY
jgi:hypothetical protein